MDEMTVSASMAIAYFRQKSFTLCEHMSYCIRDIHVSDADIAQIKLTKMEKMYVCTVCLVTWAVSK